MIADDHLDTLDPEQLREALRAARAEMARKDEALLFKQTLIDKLTHENAVLKRLKFAAKSEAYTAEQKSLLEETLDMDLAAVAAEIEVLQPRAKPADEKKQPKRAPLPPHLPRREIHHEPENTTCGCGQAMQRIGEDVAEKLDYQPGVFTVERHVRGKWVCGCCEKLVQAPVAPHVIDKGLPTAGLLAQVLVAKYLDHLPLYRQEAIFERAGHAIARSTLAQWVGECGVQLQPLVHALSAELLRQGVLHADETPVAMLKPGHGKTHRAYLWSYCSTQFNPNRRAARHQRSRPVADALHQWLGLQRQKVPDGSATARAIDYSLNRWAALTRYIDDGELPIDNNWVENRIRPIAIGRQNWLFAGSLRAGKRAAAVMSLIHSAKLNGLDPYAYIRDVLERLPTQPASRIGELLPHQWQTA